MSDSADRPAPSQPIIGLAAANPAGAAAFTDALRQYVIDLTANFASLTVAQPEDQLKAPVMVLLAAAGDAAGRRVLSRTETKVDGLGGRPDLGVDADRLPVGNVELKTPGAGADPDRFTDQRSRDQWERFKALPNLVYTDGRSWALYRSGERVTGPVELPFDPTHAAPADVTDASAHELLDLMGFFIRWEPVVPSSAPALARMLAPLARLLRDEVLADVQAGGVMERLAREWRATLFPEANEQTFADGYAQTFAYALLLARLEGAAAPIDADGAAAVLDREHSLLAQALRVLGQPGTRDAIGMPVGLLERVIGAVDPGRLSRAGDPWLYFYEHFLAAYDPVQRRNRGVYYTPIEVVESQVRLSHDLLVRRLGKAQGFAEPGVVVLDPAAGTGTYPLSVIRQALDEVQARGGLGLVPEVATRLAESVNAFELLVGPYAVTHLRVSQVLDDAGARQPPGGIHVFLTDTLDTPAHEGFAAEATLFQERLAAEQERASRIKAPETYVTVVLGNPPYNRDASGFATTGRRKGGMIRHGTRNGELGLIRGFLDPLPDVIRRAHALNLYNDYVYFLRWGIWKTAEQHPDSPSILTFITASAYLTGPAFGGVREMLRRHYDELWIIDLGGGGRGTRRDENVFEGILTAVAILIAIRTGTDPAESGAPVHYRRIRGSRQEKLEQLAAIEDLQSEGWDLAPTGWQERLEPLDRGSLANWPGITSLMPWTARGIQFSRTWVVSHSPASLEARWRRLVTARRNDRASLLHESRDSQVTQNAESFFSGTRLTRLDSVSGTASPDALELVGYRSFDRQWCLADARVVDMPRRVLWDTKSDSQIFFSFLPGGTVSGPTLVAHTHVPDLNATIGSNGGLVIPAYRDRAASSANITPGVLELLSARYGREISAQDFLAYIFAILGTGAYADEFAAEMMAGDPSVPFPVSADLFTRTVELGRDLLWWATHGERYGPAGARPALPPGTARNTRAVANDPRRYPEDSEYDPVTLVLRVGNGEFAPVDPEVWNFNVSGMRVVESWLGYRMKSRSGRTSSALDGILVGGWSWSGELLELLAIVERFVRAAAEAGDLLADVLAGETIELAAFPTPSRADSRAPTRAEPDHQQALPLDS